MKHIAIALLAIATVALRAATPVEEKAFVEKYKKAFEAGDTMTPNSNHTPS